MPRPRTTRSSGSRSPLRPSRSKQLGLAQRAGRRARAPRLRFFFQAEDGIRDKLVTGVQTCALPIFERQELVPLLTGHLHGEGEGDGEFAGKRSEERRVGKECRSRWAADE